MTAVDTEPSEDLTRTWGIVFLSLLSAVLLFVLLRNPASERQTVHGSSERESGQGASSSQPTQEAPASPSTNAGNYYRGWPLFEGWPLPQLPPGPPPALPPSKPAPEAPPPAPRQRQ